MGIGRFAFTPILPMMLEDRVVSIASGGWLASANYVGYLAGAVALIWVPIPATIAIRGGLATIGVVTLAMGVAQQFALWIVLRTIAGVASAAVLVNVSAWCLERLAPAGRPVLQSLVFTGVGTGLALAGLVCLALMHVGASSAAAWIVFGVLSFALTAIVWPVFHGADRGRMRPASTPARADVRRVDWTRLVVCYGAFGFGYIIPATFIPAMARQSFPDPAVFGWSWPIFGAAAILSTLARAAVPRSLGNRRVWIASHLVMALGVVLPVIRPGITATMLAALLVGGTFMVITMVGMQEGREAGGARGTELMAAMTSAFALGQIAGPISVSYLVRAAGGFGVALVVAAACLVISAYALFRGASPAPAASARRSAAEAPSSRDARRS